MRARRIIDGASFGPEVLKVVRQAFDETWTNIAPMFAPGEYDDAREALALAVMTAARDDSADATPMREAAIRAMHRKYPSRFSTGTGERTFSPCN
jgi:hypothetical protein